MTASPFIVKIYGNCSSDNFLKAIDPCLFSCLKTEELLLAWIVFYCRMPLMKLQWNSIKRYELLFCCDFYDLRNFQDIRSFLRSSKYHHIILLSPLFKNFYLWGHLVWERLANSRSPSKLLRLRVGLNLGLSMFSPTHESIHYTGCLHLEK